MYRKDIPEVKAKSDPPMPVIREEPTEEGRVTSHQDHLNPVIE
jgi:hypothetical protein